MKKITAGLLILFLVSFSAKLAATDYIIRVGLRNIDINNENVFRGDTTIRIQTSGKDPSQRTVAFQNADYQVAFSFEVRPGGKDPNLKKYGSKDKTWKYKTHMWVKRKNGPWEEISSDINWMYLSRRGQAMCTVSSTITGGTASGLNSIAVKFSLDIRNG